RSYCGSSDGNAFTLESIVGCILTTFPDRSTGVFLCRSAGLGVVSAPRQNTAADTCGETRFYFGTPRCRSQHFPVVGSARIACAGMAPEDRVPARILPHHRTMVDSKLSRGAIVHAVWHRRRNQPSRRVWTESPEGARPVGS